jgi:hypothetical protein
MSKTTYMIQMNDLDAAEMLRELAKEDIRSFGSETAWLIRQEHARRFAFDNTENTASANGEKQFAPKAQ